MANRFCRGEDHPAFNHPPGNSKIWRYVGLPQLLSILQKGALHFTRLDKFEDPWEGAIPKKMVDAERAMFAEHGIPISTFNQDIHRINCSRYAACCWHLNEHESEAMWKLYAAAGIAIQSTFQRLLECLPSDDRENAYPIFAGRVGYIDYDTDPLNPMLIDGQLRWNNAFLQVMHKRRSFQHEQEVRALFTRRLDGTVEEIFERLQDGSMRIRSGIAPEGEYVPVDLTTLIERLVVSPLMPTWFQEVVATAVEKHGFNFPVEASKQSALPEYGLFPKP